MSTLATLKVNVVTDASAAVAGMGALSKASSGFASKLQTLSATSTRVGKSISLGLTLPFVAFGKVAIDELGEAQKATAQTEAVIKSTGAAANVTASEIANMSERLGDMAVMDDEVIQAGANLLLTFKNIRNEVGAGNDIFTQTTKTALDLSVAFDKSLSSSAIILGKALNDPIKGLTSLGRMGVQFSEQQVAVITRLVETGKVLEAQKFILAEVNSQVRDSAKAAGDAATPIEKLKIQFENFAEAAGAVLLPIVQSLVGWLRNVMNAFQNVSPATQKTIVTVLAVVAAIGPLLFIFGKLVAVLRIVVITFNLLKIAMLANPFIAIAAAVIAIAALIVMNWDKIKAFLVGIWNAIKDVAKAVWDGITGFFRGVFDGVKAVFVGTWNAIKGTLVGIWHAIRDTAKAIWDGIKDAARTIWNAMKEPVLSAWRAIKGALSGIWNGIKSSAVAVWNAIKDAVMGVIDAVKAALDWLGKDIPGGGIGSALGAHAGGNLPGLADGGRVLRAGLVRVGERGPETLLLPSGAQVFPGAGDVPLLAKGGGGSPSLKGLVVHGDFEMTKDGRGVLRGIIADELDEGGLADEALKRSMRRSGH